MTRVTGGWRRGHLVLGPAVLAQPAIARCSWQLQLMDVALGLELKVGDMRSLSRSLGIRCRPCGVLGGVK